MSLCCEIPRHCCGKKREEDLLDRSCVALRFHLEDYLGKLVGVREDVFCDLSPQRGRRVRPLEDATEGSEHAAVVVWHDAQG